MHMEVRGNGTENHYMIATMVDNDNLFEHWFLSKRGVTDIFPKNILNNSYRKIADNKKSQITKPLAGKRAIQLP